MRIITNWKHTGKHQIQNTTGHTHTHTQIQPYNLHTERINHQCQILNGI